MEWMNKSGEQPVASQPSHGGGHRGKKVGPFNLRVVSVALLFCITILVVALIWLISQGSATPESKFVKNDRLQAVFLNGGQVYFGNIKSLNSSYLKMGNIYYLRVNQTVQPNQTTATGQQATTNDISLVKLGCELHGPEDDMVINRDQIIFWENLKTDGQVAKAVADYVKQNPNGQQCTTPSSNATPSTDTTPSTNPTPNTNRNR